MSLLEKKQKITRFYFFIKKKNIGIGTSFKKIIKELKKFKTKNYFL